MKKNKTVVVLIVAGCLLFSCGLCTIITFVLDKKDKPVTKEKSYYDSYKDSVGMTGNHFEKGNSEFEKGNWGEAEFQFSQIKDNDSTYSIAQEKMKICEKNIKTENDAFQKEKQGKDKKRLAIEKKYKSIFGGNGWISEKEAKLMNNGFKQYKSGYEKCPDGSEQIATYYSKNVDGFTVNVMLQYSYSIEHHYSKVWVE